MMPLERYAELAPWEKSKCTKFIGMLVSNMSVAILDAPVKWSTYIEFDNRFKEVTKSVPFDGRAAINLFTEVVHTYPEHDQQFKMRQEQLKEHSEKYKELRYIFEEEDAA